MSGTTSHFTVAARFSVHFSWPILPLISAKSRESVPGTAAWPNPLAIKMVPLTSEVATLRGGILALEYTLSVYLLVNLD